MLAQGQEQPQTLASMHHMGVSIVNCSMAKQAHTRHYVGSRVCIGRLAHEQHLAWCLHCLMWLHMLNVLPVKCGLNTRFSLYSCRKRAKGGGEQGEDRGSLWVTPMQWMQELSNGETQGKLYCPRYAPFSDPFPCPRAFACTSICFATTLVAHMLACVPFRDFFEQHL